MNTMISFHYDASGSLRYTCAESSFKELSKEQKSLLDSALLQTHELIKNDSASFCGSLKQKRVQLRIVDVLEGPACLLSHEILLKAALLNPDKGRLKHRRQLLVGILYRMLYHWCNPELHVTQIRLRTLRFLWKQESLRNAAIQEIQNHPEAFNEPDWLESLRQVDDLMLLDRFWSRLALTSSAKTIFAAARGTTARLRPMVKDVIAVFAKRALSQKQKIRFGGLFKW